MLKNKSRIKARCHLVNCGPTLIAHARKSALEDGCPIITFNRDGSQTVEYPAKIKGGRYGDSEQMQMRKNEA